MSRRVLILGGTSEARDLAAMTVSRFGSRIDVITSLAGRTQAPADYAGRVRLGGFGGAEGLAAYLQRERIDLLIDATHPFAATISTHAVAAAAQTGVKLLALIRPEWQPQSGDRWLVVPDANAAAEAVRSLGRRVFLSFGGRELEAFAPLKEIWFLVRRIDPPAQPLPLASYEMSLGRGPFSLADERNLLRAHGIEVLVTKASGGTATRAKLDAARELGVPVVMIRRPVPQAAAVSTPEEAADRIAALLEAPLIDWCSRSA